MSLQIKTSLKTKVIFHIEWYLISCEFPFLLTNGEDALRNRISVTGSLRWREISSNAWAFQIAQAFHTCFSSVQTTCLDLFFFFFSSSYRNRIEKRENSLAVDFELSGGKNLYFLTWYEITKTEFFCFIFHFRYFQK